MSLGAIIVAGGDSKRFASKIPKQFNIINDDIVINHSIKKFLKNKKISKVIIAVDKKSYIKFEKLIIKDKKIIIAKWWKNQGSLCQKWSKNCKYSPFNQDTDSRCC